MKRYLLVASRPWNIETFMSWRGKLEGNWQVCISPDDLEYALESTGPRYAFFVHWSHKVPARILAEHECVCFHMTDLPYGRGGSPLQNLIKNGHRETVLTALRMTSEFDAGPIYLKHPLSLEGTARDIFGRAAELGMEMIREIIDIEPQPTPQEGVPVIYTRRTPEQSELPKDGSTTDLYDHIRMLDAPGYPHAFLKQGKWKGTLTDAHWIGRTLEARIRFVAAEEEN